MADDAASLSTYVQSVERSQILIELTNYDTTSATTINTSILGLICQQAIYWFNGLIDDYAPSANAWNQEAASKYVMLLLFQRAGRYDEGESYSKACDQYVKAAVSPARYRRSLNPYTTGTTDDVIYSDDNGFWSDYEIDT